MDDALNWKKKPVLHSNGLNKTENALFDKPSLLDPCRHNPEWLPHLYFCDNLHIRLSHYT